MKKAIVIWAFLFLILVLLTAEAINSNRTELSRVFTLKLNLPFGYAYETIYAPNVAEYFGMCILLGGFVVMILSMGAVLHAHREAKRARRELEEAQAELRRLRGTAENDEVYQTSFSGGKSD